MLDSRAFRQVMGTFPTGVTVVTASDPGGTPLGLTVNSFTSVSLDPPLVLVCIGRASASHDRLVASGSFGVSILAADQAGVAWRFAAEPSEGRFDGVGWQEAPGGAPVLSGAAAWLACSLEEVHAGGDHSILVGRVEAAGGSDAPALAFYRGSFGSVTR